MSDDTPHLCVMCREMALFNDDHVEDFKNQEEEMNDQYLTTESYSAPLASLAAMEPSRGTADESTVAKTLPAVSATVVSRDPGVECSENFEQTVRTGWEVHDKLPELPILESSWKNGCDFCGFLRGAILSNDTKYSWTADGSLSRASPGFPHLDVRICLEYSWVHGNSHCTPGFGLDKLKCVLESTGSKSWKPTAIQFHVEAEACKFKNTQSSQTTRCREYSDQYDWTRPRVTGARMAWSTA